MSELLHPNEADTACFIVNPKAAGGATGARIDELQRSVERYFQRAEVVQTEGPGHGTELAARAIRGGANLIVAVGGDGTVNEVGNGLFDGETALSPDTCFTVVPAGTGSDYVRSLGMPKRLDDAVRLAAFGPDLPGDVLSVRFRDEAGEEQHRICMNVSGFGMNGDTVARANRSSKRLGGTLTFFGATLGSLAGYEPMQVDLRWERADGGEGSWSGRLLSCFVCNGQWAGGGMNVGRGGSLLDGAAELIIIPELSLPRTLALTPHLYRGTLGTVKGVVTDRIRTLQAEDRPAGTARVDVDGEQPGTLPISVKVLAKAVRLRGVWADRS